MARQGKIARLPHALREKLNARLLNGESAAEVLRWLNAQPAATKVWQTIFDGAPATPQNLSNWRDGGYAEWLARQARVEDMKTLSAFALDVAKSGGHLADGAAAIVAGQILEAVETLGNLAVTGGSDDADKDPAAGLAKMASAIASLQSGTIAKERLELDKIKVQQKAGAMQLDREKHELQTARKFIEWAKSPEAAAILDSGKPKHVQMDKLRELMFGPTS